MQMTVEHEMEEILIFNEDHIPGNPYTRSMGIVTNITLVRDSINKKNTLNRPSSKFVVHEEGDAQNKHNQMYEDQNIKENDQTT